MKSELKYGLLLGFLSGIWLLIMHYAGVYSTDDSTKDKTSWMEYASVVIPLFCLYFGIKQYRDAKASGKMEVFEGLVQGFKILIVGGIIAALFSVIYIQYVPSVLQTEYMGRIVGAGSIGILLNITISLSLMNKQKYL